MQSNFRQPKSLPKARTRTYISTWAWVIFVSSTVLFVGSVFTSTWTSTGPTFFSVQGSPSNQSGN